MQEVEADVLSFFERIARTRSLDLDQLASDLSPSWSALRSAGPRVSWDLIAELCERTGAALGGPEAAEIAGEQALYMTNVQRFVPLLGAVVPLRYLYTLCVRWLGPRVYPHLRWSIDAGERQAVVDISIASEHADSPMFFRFGAGCLRALPRLVGREKATVDVTIGERSGHFVVRYPAERFRPVLNWFRRADSLAPVYAELITQQQELQRQFQDLQKSERELRALLEERERTQRERQELERKLALADRLTSMGRLAAGIGHEINNPLTYAGASVVLARARLGEPAKVAQVDQLLANAAEGIERVAHVVRGLRLLSRPDEEASSVELREVVTTALSIAEHELKHRARVIVEHRGAAKVRGNAARLGQVVINLLVNAAQAFPDQNTERNEIRVTTGMARDGRVELAVQDNGAGMPEQVRARAFDAFFTTKAIGEGTGLGLSICHGIVSALGGEIVIESSVGEGTTVRVLLNAIEDARDAGQAEVSSSRAATGTRRLRVLVIDDDAAVCAVVRAGLDEHDVTVLTNGREAFQACLELEFDAILCDVMMPIMSGVELYEELARVRPELCRRFGFMSGGASTHEMQAFLARVQRPLLDKPFSLGALNVFVSSLYVDE